MRVLMCAIEWACVCLCALCICLCTSFFGFPHVWFYQSYKGDFFFFSLFAPRSELLSVRSAHAKCRIKCPWFDCNAEFRMECKQNESAQAFFYFFWQRFGTESLDMLVFTNDQFILVRSLNWVQLTHFTRNYLIIMAVSLQLSVPMVWWKCQVEQPTVLWCGRWMFCVLHSKEVMDNYIVLIIVIIPRE